MGSLFCKWKAKIHWDFGKPTELKGSRPMIWDDFRDISYYLQMEISSEEINNMRHPKKVEILMEEDR